MSNLSPELQRLVSEKESTYVKPKYFLGEEQVKVVRVSYRLKDKTLYRWYEITDEMLLSGSSSVKNIRREPPFRESDNFA